MFRTDNVRLADLGLEIGYLKNLFRLLCQGNIAQLPICNFLVGTLLDFLLEFVKIYVKVFENSCSNAFSFLDQTQKQVFCTYIVMAQPQSLLPAVTDDILYSVRKISVHSPAL